MFMITACAKTMLVEEISAGIVDCHNLGYSLDCNEPRFQNFLYRNRNKSLPERLRADEKGGRAFALVVGVNTYNKDVCPSFSSLKKPVDEAKELSRILDANGYIVKTLIESEATAKNIMDWLIFMASHTNDGDRILIYFAGHGATLHDVRKRNVWSAKKTSIQNKEPKRDRYEPFRDYDLLLAPYQTAIPFNGQAQSVCTVIPSIEITEVLSRSRAAEIIVLYDACSAHIAKVYTFHPIPFYSYALQRQGYFNLSLLKEVNLDGEFSPILFRALRGGADRTGNRDNIVSMFETVNFFNPEWNDKLGARGIPGNQVKYIIYGSGDMPLTLTKP
jgi:hypothetical protein